jgi:SAM-dependent methyltransferase
MNYLTEEQRKDIRRDIYVSGGSKYIGSSDAKIKFFLKYCSNKSVLDLGSVDHHPKNAASHYWLFGQIQKVSKALIGLDFYESGVEKLSALGHNIKVADAQNFQFNEKYEVVTCGDIIEHVENPGQMFACVQKHLEPGGKFIVATPNPHCWKYFGYLALFGDLRRINQEHVSWFCAETLRLLGKRFNFEVIEHCYVSRRWWEKLMPLPKYIKHTTILVAYKLKEK